MKDEKEPLEQKQNSEEEEYSFLQEIIKDEAGDQAKWKHDVLRRIQLGLIFGLVACFTFFACKPWVEKRFEENPTEVTIPQDEQQEERREDHPCYIFRRQSVRCHLEEPGCRVGTVCLCSSEKEYCG